MAGAQIYLEIGLSMLHCYIGNGKGKTTAALGIALRAAGWGKRVYIAQFLKDIQYPCGEIRATSALKGNIIIERFAHQIHPMFLKNRPCDTGKLKKSIQQSLARIKGFIAAGKFDMIILDEILDAVAEGFTTKRKVMDVLKKARELEVVLTGRKVPLEIVRMADYVSRIEKIKHPFDKKCLARRGVEY